MVVIRGRPESHPFAIIYIGWLKFRVAYQCTSIVFVCLLSVHAIDRIGVFVEGVCVH